tara:strand:+ start:373 stop:615 length:243 start_codon:yes stop_codon:yes gene_type:complete
MKTKKLLFGLIEMNCTLYNILYTVLCVVVLLLLLAGLATLSTEIFKPEETKGFTYYLLMITSSFIIYFVGSKLLDKNNYS